MTLKTICDEHFDRYPCRYLVYYRDENLPSHIKDRMEDSNTDCFVSIASLWGGIKHSLGKLHLQTDLRKVFYLIEESGLKILPISPNHILTNAAMDFHHRDPFDRLIIAQAKSEGWPVISKDVEFKNYDLNVMWI